MTIQQKKIELFMDRIFMKFINRVLLSCFFAFSLLLGAAVFSEIHPPKIQIFTIEECLLPDDHPLQASLKKIFRNQIPDIFNSPQNLKTAGFQVLSRIHRGLMVAGHSKIPNYFIKKFKNKVEHSRQLNNYLRRIHGARNLNEFLQTNQFKHIVTPKKWLYPLPECFSDPETGLRTFVLIVEKIDILNIDNVSNKNVSQKYRNISFEILRELCATVYFFRGLDSSFGNMPFTHQNKIAFIDTERWDWEREGYLWRAMPFLSPDRQEYALAIFKELETQNNPSQ